MTILELESCLNLNQVLIDNVVREMKINNVNDNAINKKFSSRLSDLNSQRDKIITEIELKLNEAFPK